MAQLLVTQDNTITHIVLPANNTCGARDRPPVMGPHLSLKPSVMYWTPEKWMKEIFAYVLDNKYL